MQSSWYDSVDHTAFDPTARAGELVCARSWWPRCASRPARDGGRAGYDPRVTGVALTTWEVMDERAAMLAVLSEVLAAVESDSVLVGGLAVGYHGRLRATVDVDLLVRKRKIGRIAKELAARGFVVVRQDGMARVYAAGAAPGRDEAIARLVEREANPVLREAARASEEAIVLGHRLEVVSRGALVALKFHAALSPTRRLGDRYQDVADIDRIVAKHFDAEDEALAVAAGAYPGAGDDLARMLADLRAGRPVRL